MNINNKLLSGETFQRILRTREEELTNELSEIRSLLKLGGAKAHGEDGPDAPAMAAIVNAVDAPTPEQVAAFVVTSPGSTSSIIKKQFQMTREQWDVIRNHPVFKAMVESKGQKRGTRYFVRENA